MKILITGNLGYVGAYLCRYLRTTYPKAFIAGYDLGYFQHCLTTGGCAPEVDLDLQYYGDVRNFNEDLLKGFEHVVHLAAISNDPIGNKFEQVTHEVNYKASVDIARKAIRQGLKSFVYASSCSVYGAGGDEAKTERSDLNPLTAYAKSKIQTELDLEKLDKGDTVITSLRFATACGISDRLRLDLVLNDFVASAMTTGQISILSDGTPWRPLINVKDMVRAMDWARQRPASEGGQMLVCNTGSNRWNYIIKDLALCVQNQFQNVRVDINSAAPPDKRSYRVNFDLFTSLAGPYAPIYDIDRTVEELKKGLEIIDFKDADFRNSQYMRLNVLNRLISRGVLDKDLHWKPLKMDA